MVMKINVNRSYTIEIDHQEAVELSNALSAMVNALGLVDNYDQNGRVRMLSERLHDALTSVVVKI